MAEELTVEDGPELVWLGAAMIIGADPHRRDAALRRRPHPLMPIPGWTENPIDPISVRDVLYYLVAATDPGQVPAGAYDIRGPTTTRTGVCSGRMREFRAGGKRGRGCSGCRPR